VTSNTIINPAGNERGGGGGGGGEEEEEGKKEEVKTYERKAFFKN
jgi:hypothetical protein